MTTALVPANQGSFFDLSLSVSHVIVCLCSCAEEQKKDSFEYHSEDAPAIADELEFEADVQKLSDEQDECGSFIFHFHQSLELLFGADSDFLIVPEKLYFL